MIHLIILKIFLALAWTNMIIAILLCYPYYYYESDYAYDMKSPKLGDVLFDEDDVFENIFATINVCPKLGDATFNEDDIFIKHSFPKLVALHIISIMDIQGIRTNNIAIMLIIHIFHAKIICNSSSNTLAQFSFPSYS